MLYQSSGASVGYNSLPVRWCTAQYCTVHATTTAQSGPALGPGNTAASCYTEPPGGHTSYTPVVTPQQCQHRTSDISVDISAPSESSEDVSVVQV